MVQKITCPECNAEFDLAEGYKKHLKNLEAKTRAEAEKKAKDSAKREIQETKKKQSNGLKKKLKLNKKRKTKFKRNYKPSNKKTNKPKKNTRITTTIYLILKLKLLKRIWSKSNRKKIN